MMILTHTFNSIQQIHGPALTVVLVLICIVLLVLLVCGIIECYRK